MSLRTVPLSHNELRRWYLEYNRRYFEGRLPLDIAVVWEPTEEDMGSYDEEERKLILDPKYALVPRVARMTLLHEMCHVALAPQRNHGAGFQREMQRLARAGAFSRLW